MWRTCSKCVVYLSAKDADDEALKQIGSPTATPVPSQEPTATHQSSDAPTASPTSAPTATPAPDTGETPLTYLAPGSWELMGISFGGQFVNDELTIYINDASTGTFYS